MDIFKLLSNGERVTLECKKATRGIPSSLWDTYSAFANTYGGTILLGVIEHMDEQDCSSSPKWTQKMIINYLYF